MKKYFCDTLFDPEMPAPQISPFVARGPLRISMRRSRPEDTALDFDLSRQARFIARLAETPVS